MSRRRFTVIHLTPAVITILLAPMFAEALRGSGLLDELETPFSRGESPVDTLYNLAVFSAMFAPTVIALYILVVKKRINLLKLMFTASLAIAFSGLAEIYMLCLAEYFGFGDSWLDTVILVVTATTGVLTVVVCLVDVPAFLEASVSLLFGAGAGALFGGVLPLWSVSAISLALSFYDIYAVFYGPLKKLVELESRKSPRTGNDERVEKAFLLKGVSVPFLNYRLGLGDVVFYSMLVARAYLYEPVASLPRAFAVALGILVGLYATLKLLEKRVAMPALPIPMFIGNALLLASITLNQ